MSNVDFALQTAGVLAQHALDKIKALEAERDDLVHAVGYGARLILLEQR